MKNELRWTGLFVAMAAAAALLTWLLMWGGGYWQEVSCQGLSRSDCVNAKALGVQRTALVATVLGIILSAIGTAALVVTIFYTSRATSASIKAARAANHAVELARQTASRELRPYMAFDTFTMVYRPSPEGRATAWWVRVHWINTGATPAINVRARANYAIVDGELPADFDFPDRVMDDSVGSIGREKNFSTATGDITLEQVADIIASRRRLFVWSWVEYDGFDSPQRYRSEWHSEMNLWGVDDPSDPAMWSESMLRSRFNGTDGHAFRPPHPTGGEGPGKP